MKAFGTIVSRPCYDKFWRCPGWAGPGWSSTENPYCPSGGGHYGAIDWDKRWKFLGKEIYAPRWVAWRCPECDTWVLPYGIRLVDPSFWWGYLPWRIRNKWLDWRYERKWKRSQNWR